MRTKSLSLYKKLLITFFGLAFMAVLICGATIWSMVQWKQVNSSLREHYQRSLILQEIRGTLFRAIKEVPNAISLRDKESIKQFKELTGSTKESFKRWGSLAHSDEELTQVVEIKAAYNEVVNDSNAIFQLLDKGQVGEAIQSMERKLDGYSIPRFQELTKIAVQSDFFNRQTIREQSQNVQQTVKIMLGIAIFGAISILLLLFAYLTSDLFLPLRQLRQSLRAVANGDYQQRMVEHRGDELGEIQREFNRMVGSIARRQQVLSVAKNSKLTAANDTSEKEISVRDTLRSVLYHLRTQLKQVHHQANERADKTLDDLLVQLKHLLNMVERFAELGFPLDLNLARTEVRPLLNEVILNYLDLMAEQGVNFEVEISPEVSTVVVDKLKLRMAIGELVHNALASLPEFGRHIGIRVRHHNEGSNIQIEVADDGEGTPVDFEEILNRYKDSTIKRPPMGLAYARAIVEEHGGQLFIQSIPGQGTRVTIRLPLTN